MLLMIMMIRKRSQPYGARCHPCVEICNESASQNTPTVLTLAAVSDLNSGRMIKEMDDE